MEQLKLPTYYETQVCNNSFIDRIVLYNSDTKKYFQPKCKSYSCPKHGFIQRQRLEKGIKKWLDGHKIIRFWTFTMRSDKTKTNEQNNEIFKKAWHRFITELRRNKMLTKKERSLQYVKVYELHKTGILHVHLFSTVYIHWVKLQSLWDYALGAQQNKTGKLGNVNVKGMTNSGRAAKYISKYVTKMAIQKEVKVRSWSKSGKVAIFDKRVSSGNWHIIRKDSVDYIHLKNGEPILVGISASVTKISRKKVRAPDHPRLWAEYFDYFLNIWLIKE